jgi:outer membrane protein OmpA-like peptidoglycan-associated protein
LLFCVPVLVSTFAAAQNSAKNDVLADGIIKSKTGETLIVTNPEKQATTTVLLTNDTKVHQLKVFSSKDVAADVLIPGLKISFEGTSDDQGRVVAKKIDFDSGDMETAQMIQAGLHPTAEQVAANQQQTEQNKEQTEQNRQQIEQNTKDTAANANRLSEFGEYEAKGGATVNFPVNSSKMSAEDKDALRKLASDLANQKGYIIEIRGYADNRGTATMNERLSDERAQAVADFLVEDCNVPMRHVITPAAMGETHAAATNETAAGRAENRRAEVKVLVNKGLAGK